jgi:hypothetical protein
MANPDLDPYAVLGVPRNATSDEIKNAYRELVAKYHPDRHQDNPLEDLAVAKLAEINRAYEILSDPERRAAYDRGQPAWPRPVGSPFDKMSFGGRRRKRIPFLYIIGIILLLPLLLRTLPRLVRLGLEGLSATSGTPFGLVVLVAIVALVLWLYVKRRKRR